MRAALLASTSAPEPRRRGSGSAPAAPELRRTLADLVAQVGVAKLARAMHMAPGTLRSLLDGLPVNHGTRLKAALYRQVDLGAACCTRFGEGET